MNEQSHPQQPLNPAEELRQPLTFDERIAHLAGGYSNSQETVRFLDTKAAAVIGAVPVVLGILAAVFAWVQQAWKWQKLMDVCGWWVAGVVGLVMVLLALLLLLQSWRALAAAFDVLKPRDSGTARPSVVFPIATAGTESFESRVLHFADGPLKRDAVEDYRRQLIRLSEIVAQKLKDVQIAVGHLKQMFFLSVIMLGAMVMLAVGSGAVTAYYHPDIGAEAGSVDVTP